MILTGKNYYNNSNDLMSLFATSFKTRRRRNIKKCLHLKKNRYLAYTFNSISSPKLSRIYRRTKRRFGIWHSRDVYKSTAVKTSLRTILTSRHSSDFFWHLSFWSLSPYFITSKFRRFAVARLKRQNAKINTVTRFWVGFGRRVFFYRKGQNQRMGKGVGSYFSSRRLVSGFMRILYLSMTHQFSIYHFKNYVRMRIPSKTSCSIRFLNKEEEGRIGSFGFSKELLFFKKKNPMSAVNHISKRRSTYNWIMLKFFKNLRTNLPPRPNYYNQSKLEILTMSRVSLFKKKKQDIFKKFLWAFLSFKTFSSALPFFLWRLKNKKNYGLARFFYFLTRKRRRRLRLFKYIGLDKSPIFLSISIEQHPVLDLSYLDKSLNYNDVGDVLFISKLIYS